MAHEIRDECPSHFPLLQLASTANFQPITIHQMQQNQPHRQLGFHLVPLLSPKPQLQLLQLLENRSRDLKVTLRRNRITAHQGATIFEHYIAPSISYPCITQSIQTSAIGKLQNVTLSPILAKLSRASTSARDMIYLPAKFGEAGFKRWSSEILARQISQLTNQMDSHEWIGFVIRPLIKTSPGIGTQCSCFLEFYRV